MPTSKSSTLSEDAPFYRAYLKQKEVAGDYKALLDQLLAYVHRDGGQYTQLTGYATSVEDGIDIVLKTREELRDLKASKR
ncbi:MAG TPA: hypothetical protein VM656_14990 [Pyrinomonadaceae bacterium]|jgi:hypothetical protein|nr:hypothetical protein [Pyrinomonadaceae bacterium]